MENNLPRGWVICPPFEIAEKIRGVSYDKNEISFTHDNELIPVMRANNIEDNNLVYKELVYAPQKSISDNQLLRKGDVVIAMSSGSKNLVGKTAQYFNDIKISFGAFCSALRPSKEINSKYFGYYFQSREYRNIISELSAGTNINNLKNEHFEALQIPLPPLAEQHRIVAKLDAVMQKVESNKQRLDKIPKLLKRFRQSVLFEAYKGNLTQKWREENVSKYSSQESLKAVIKERVIRKRTESINDSNIILEIPDSWVLTNIDSISNFVVDCPHSTPKWSPSGKLCLRTSNFLPNKLNLNERKFVSETVYLDRISRLKPQKGDVLYSREGGILGIACILDLDEDVCLGQRMMMFRLNQNIDSKYICYFLNSPTILSHVNTLIGGSAAPHINVGDIKEYPIPFPSFEEQKEIVRRIEQLFAFADKIESRYFKVKAMLDKLPQSILAKAFRGELVAQNPNDEPASVLLERIKAEREKLVAEKKGKKLKEYSNEGKPLKIAGKRKLNTIK